MMWNIFYEMTSRFGGWIAGFIILLFFVTVGLVIFFAIKQKGIYTDSYDSSDDETQLDILQEQNAEGEMTEKEYIDIKSKVEQ
jgi:uncharacterized membrane protein